MEKNKYRRIKRENGISEACAMHKCYQSDHVASLIEAFTHKEFTYLVTKYYREGDLMSYMESRKICRLPESEVRHIVRQVATAIKDCHDLNIVHRDIKHLNILITIVEGQPVVKLADFGMAALLAKGEMISKLAGTIGFMAPEVVAEGPSDFKVDIWSLGVVTYALFSAQVPF